MLVATWRKAYSKSPTLRAASVCACQPNSLPAGSPTVSAHRLMVSIHAAATCWGLRPVARRAEAIASAMASRTKKVSTSTVGTLRTAHEPSLTRPDGV